MNEWDNEPDRIEFESLGLPCLIVRNDFGGVLCGYVGVPEGHPWYHKNYEQIKNDDQVFVHGHTPKPGESDKVWWLGFDCGHAGDIVPKKRDVLPSLYKFGVYRNIDYVKSECEKLALQCIAKVNSPKALSK
jgi:hypothetical protein